MSATRGEGPPPESDRFGEAPHPRETPVLFGHRSAEAELLEAYRSGRLPHAWIIGGREGIGKATLAWRFARFVFANPDPQGPELTAAADLGVAPEHPASRQTASLSHPDLAVLRRAWNDKAKKHYTEIRVDEVRRIGHLFQHAAARQGYRVCIVDSADDLNRHAANALLKLIEEPPARSLFLFVAHRPGRIIPTIRSRCRLLLLQPLAAPDVGRALAAACAGANIDAQAMAAAAARAGGSIREALQILEEGAAAQWRGRLADLLARLPAVDWRDVHHLADAVAPRGAADAYASLIGTVLDWIDATVVARAQAGPGRLAPYAEVWEKFGAAAREADALNLDKRPLILSLFADLAAATRANGS